MARTVREKTGVDARVKWPNDILVGGAKLCGMLAEMEAETDRVIFLNIGMGMNVNNDPSKLEPAATSLKALVGGDVSRTNLLAAFLDTFEKQLEQLQLDRIVDEWKALTMTIGRAVRVVTANDEISGIAENIDDSGALMVRQADGAIRRAIYGDCFVQ
jgi:BirA family biotin operon repressor/biotin-[acetyl-CoA-carboxylase] ligase